LKVAVYVEVFKICQQISLIYHIYSQYADTTVIDYPSEHLNIYKNQPFQFAHHTMIHECHVYTSKSSASGVLQQCSL